MVYFVWSLKTPKQDVCHPSARGARSRA
jgi:hypothetical protein